MIETNSAIFTSEEIEKKLKGLTKGEVLFRVSQRNFSNDSQKYNVYGKIDASERKKKNKVLVFKGSVLYTPEKANNMDVFKKDRDTLRKNGKIAQNEDCFAEDCNFDSINAVARIINCQEGGGANSHGFQYYINKNWTTAENAESAGYKVFSNDLEKKTKSQLETIIEVLKKIRTGTPKEISEGCKKFFEKNIQQTNIRSLLYKHSADALSFDGKNDLFCYSDKDNGVWTLRELCVKEKDKKASSDNEPPKEWQSLKDKNNNEHPHNRIVFGAPGTGKSHKLEEETREIFNEEVSEYVTRVTFHPDYSYAHFVGCYKPYMEGKDIRYEFIAGPFLEVYKKAKKDPDNHYVLIIEEINRANVAAVFGDVFQLLDRYDKDNEEKGEVKGESEYPIATSKDIKDWLTKNDFDEEQAKTLSIPKNMYIWATMNSADQGVYPMDTAFKRRWTFEYMDIDEGETSITGWKITLPNNKTCDWTDLRKAINEKLIAERVNEDKCLGPHFIKKEDGKDMGKFASKVLMYLFEDVVKQNPSKIFNLEKNELIFSKVRNKFFEKGLEVFNLNKEVKSTDVSVKQEKESTIEEREISEEVAATQFGESNE